MKFPVIIILLQLYVGQCWSQTIENHHCVWYDECYFNGAHWHNCDYTGPALPVFETENDEELKEILQRRCPHLLQDAEGNAMPTEEVVTCCSLNQLRGLDESAKLADGVLARCPSCQRNFVRIICDLTCAADQSRFLTTTVLEFDNVSYVQEMDYYLHDVYMEDVFESCSGVMMPQLGIPAVNVMCGSAAVCDAQAWFDYQGDATNPYVPFQINYLKSANDTNALSNYVLPCNEAAEGSIACSCVDCAASCPISDILTPAEPSCVVLGLNCVAFSVAITVFVIAVSLFSILTIVDYCKTRPSKVNGINGNARQDTIQDLEVKSLKKFYESMFEHIGVFSSTHPMLILMLTSWLTLGMLYGARYLTISANPIEIWSSPTSQTRKEMEYFNTRFEPFYRTAQVFLKINLDPFEYETPNGNNVTYGPAFRFEAINELASLQEAIINIGRTTNEVVLENVCFAPLRQMDAEEDLSLCSIISAMTYFTGTLNENTYLNIIQNCINNYINPECLASWGGGSDPTTAFGGFINNTIQTSHTLILTIPLRNHLNEIDTLPALDWESRFIEFMTNYAADRKPEFIEVAYAAERSVEDEITRTSRAEIFPISISYILMFGYVTLALGKYRSCKTLLIDSKVFVAISSILIVLCAIICALGVMGLAGVPTTLLAINVIPFFILSVGVDNVFIMINALDIISYEIRYKSDISFNKNKKKIFGKMMTKIGPSILVTSVSQFVCFGIGTISESPAVNTFAIFASISLGFLFLFQMTTSVAIMSIDYKRDKKGRLDLFCCVRQKIDDSKPLTEEIYQEGVLQRLMNPYAKFLLKWQVKIIVVILFAAWTCSSIMIIPDLEVGLDQEMSLPEESYVRDYLIAVGTILQMGPPVYFVLTDGLNFTDPLHQNAICGGQMCNSDSLVTQIYLASLNSDITSIALSSNSWLDDYFDWTSLSGACCRYNSTDGTFCPSYDTACNVCEISMEQFGVRPLPEYFNTYLPFFLKDPPGDVCTKGGLASYSASVNYFLDDYSLAYVQESNFMAYHTSLTTSKDYYDALHYAREISDNITRSIRESTGVEVSVFPYSIFYVYYEQYLTMWQDSIAALGYSLVATLLVVLFLSGFNIFSTIAMITSVISILVNMMGVMYWWNIPLNAVSLVNLIISIGIGVEFCSHTIYAHASSSSHPRDRAYDSLQSMGSNIISGITLTNIPIIVLAFAHTQVIRVFFFKMFFSLVVLGFLHGLVLLPVILSFMSNAGSYKT